MHVDPYLVGLDLAGRRVVVVGGGTSPSAGSAGLLAAGADVEVVAPEVTPAVEGMATARELRWTARGYRDGDLDGAWYAIACTDDPAVNAAVGAEAQRAPGVLRPRRRRPAAAARSPRPSGGTTGSPSACSPGASPRRSAAVRTALVEALARRRRATTPRSRCGPGVALVGGGPGDPELITVRGRRLLPRADVVVTDRLGPRDLLDALAPHVEVIDASKIPYGRAMNQARINELLVEHARAGKFVVRLKGGDPYVFGRGFEEVLACAEAGVPVTVVPGVTSAFAAPAVADVPVSHRGVAHEIVVVSGHVAPDDPRSLVDWPALGPAARHGGAADGGGADRRVRRRADRRAAARPTHPSRWCRTARCGSSGRCAPHWRPWPTWCASRGSARRRWSSSGRWPASPTVP